MPFKFHFHKLGISSLSDALAEIKFLRRQISLRDENIACLTLEVNKLCGRISDDACSSHKATNADDMIVQGIRNEKMHTPIAFDRYHVHDRNYINLSNLLPCELTIDLVDSKNNIVNASLDR